MMNIKNLPFIMLCVVLSGCIVSKNKYDEMTADKIAAEAQAQQNEELLEAEKTTNEALRKRIESLETDSLSLATNLSKNSVELDSLNKAYGLLQGYYDDLVNKRARLNEDLAAQQQELLEARRVLELEKGKNEALLNEIDEREKKLEELEQILADKEKAVADLKKKVSAALLNFEGDDLTVEVRNGKVYVSLAEKLLFSTGSRQVDEKGVNALKKLASVLKENEDIHVMVEGHTDDVPISGNNKYLKDNWDLSVLRATSIVNMLSANGVSPQRVVASGKGEFAPVATNETTEGKAKNRRTEIILTPDLDELLQILGDQ
jgi:chemotaxis protein MotB